MNTLNTIRIHLITALFFSFFVLISCKTRSDSGKLVVTIAPSGNKAGVITGEGWRYAEGAGIFMVNPDKPSKVRKLTADFYSACSPDISWDGLFMLFAGQKNKGDSWNIWRMEIKNGKIQKISDTARNCIDPVFLPIDKMIFTGNTNMKECNALFVSNADGSDMKQITFHPHTNFGTVVLRDGRLLSITRQIKPENGDPVLMVIRPDGTKADLFYKGPSNSSLVSKPRESSGGLIYFIEKDSSGKGNIISISYNRPLHTRQIINENNSGSFTSVFPSPDGNLLVSYADGPGKSSDLYEFSVKDKRPGKKLFTMDGFNVIDVIRVDAHQRPKKLPSEVDPGVKTGLLLCQDINFKAFAIAEPNSIKATKIEVAGMDTSMGIIHAQQDGSLYLKVIADTPFRLRTLDDNNQVVNTWTPWLWLRPNERRGFVGLRDDDEMAPLNRVAMAVKKDPVTVPVVVSDIQEKEVELE